MFQRLKNYYHFFQGIFALLLYRFPGRNMTIIGVTGTDGKTTTASLLYHILHKSGKKVALVSSVGAVINGKSFDTGSHVTTPGRFAVQSYLRKAKKAGVHYVVLEVTSHALDQHRVVGIPFTVGVLTNVAKEHLDYHKTYTNYVYTKAKLLKKAKIAVVNKDDHSYILLKKIKKLRLKPFITYGFKKDARVNPHVFPFKTKLVGKFNEYNCLAAIATLQALHIPEKEIRSGIASFTPPVGRQEMVYNKGFMVINDFAHTPQAFASVLPEMKKLAKHRLIHVFGCASKRDTYKRPEMGKISSEYADVIILTAEDPRGEAVEKINAEILKGISDKHICFCHSRPVSKYGVNSGGNPVPSILPKKCVIEIPDRKEAIRFAIGLAKKGDVVLLTGKGNEQSMNYGRGEEPWDETGIALAAVRAVIKP